MVLLLGVAAVVIDLSVGFVERNRDQGAADNAVMAGALDKAEFLPNQTVSASVLTFAKSNLRDRFGTGPNDALWVELWRSCVDSGNLGWVPLPEPAAWAGVSTPTASTGSLDCISQTSSLLRVRIPDQLTETTFGKAIGAQSVSTNAVAIAKAELNSPVPPIVPFGISGAEGPGELCFVSSPAGSVEPPCIGPSSGTFGTILSELFGDFMGTPNCGNPTATNSVSINTAIGIDHLIDLWPNPGGSVVAGTSHPGDNVVLNSLADTNRDACDLVGGHAVPVDAIPLNTVLVDSGFPSGEVESGLVSNDKFIGNEDSRLQQWDEAGNPNRRVVAKRGGGPQILWDLDNRGPWYYLSAGAAAVDLSCDPGAYAPGLGLPTYGAGSKVELFNTCLAAYVASASTVELFSPTIADSPRFVWAPQYWYALPTTGLSWEPIRAFRPAFLGGVWFKGGAPVNNLVFYPDEEFDNTTGPELCIVQGVSNCHQLSLWQISAWYLPETALPPSVLDMLIGPANPRVASLWE
jgi:hypothetical protein